MDFSDKYSKLLKANPTQDKRSEISRKLLQQKDKERRLQRFDLINKNRFDSSSSTNSSSQQSHTPKIPTAKTNATTSTNRANTNVQATAKTTGVAKPPVPKKPAQTPCFPPLSIFHSKTAPTPTIPKPSSNCFSSSNTTSNSTYLIKNLENSNNNLQTNTISTSNRRKLLEQWRDEKKEKENRERNLKAKPVFKVHHVEAKVNLPTSSSFTFKVGFILFLKINVLG